jgi:uncharacterized membrane protein
MKSIYYLSLFGYSSNIAGLVTSIPAITSGLFELYAMVSSKGLDLSDPIIKTTLIHAGMNDIAIIAALYNWLSRRKVEGFAPGLSNVFLSTLMLGAVAYSGFLGGGLVYTHGVGVQRMGKGKEEKEESIKSQIEEEKKKM